jgi:hypothetical protein
VGSGLPTTSRRRWRTAGVGDGAPVEIGELLGAGELKQRLEKLVRGSVGTRGGQPWLPTMSRSRQSGSKGRRQWGSGLALGKRQKRKMNGLLGCL